MLYAAIWKSHGQYLVADVFDTPNDEPIEIHRAQGSLELDQWEWFPAEGFPDVAIDWIAEQVDGEWTFHPYVQPEPTPADILLMNQRIQESFMNQASLAMTPVLLALQLEDATDEESAKAREWQAYWRALQVVDLSVSEPAWPETPLA